MCTYSRFMKKRKYATTKSTLVMIGDQKSIIKFIQFEAIIWVKNNTKWQWNKVLKMSQFCRILLTMPSSQTNATNVTILLQIQAIWGPISKRTLGKSQTNATNVNMPHLVQVIRGHIWKHTVEKNQINATNVIMPHLRQAIWEHILKCSVEKSNKCNQCDYASSRQVMWGFIW